MLTILPVWKLYKKSEILGFFFFFKAERSLILTRKETTEKTINEHRNLDSKCCLEDMGQGGYHSTPVTFRGSQSTFRVLRRAKQDKALLHPMCKELGMQINHDSSCQQLLEKGNIPFQF